jgi:hypothetical protein
MNTTIRQTASALIRREAAALDAAQVLHRGRSALRPLESFFRRHKRVVADAVLPHLQSKRLAQRYAAHHCNAAIIAIRKALGSGVGLADNWRREGPSNVAEGIRFLA